MEGLGEHDDTAAVERLGEHDNTAAVEWLGEHDNAAAVEGLGEGVGRSGGGGVHFVWLGCF